MIPARLGRVRRRPRRRGRRLVLVRGRCACDAGIPRPRPGGIPAARAPWHPRTPRVAWKDVGRGALEGAALATWHPILAAVEPEPGRWRLVDSLGREYGTVTIVRLDGEVRYRAEFEGRLLGWGSTLRGACERVHLAFVRSHGPGEWQGYPEFFRKES